MTSVTITLPKGTVIFDVPGPNGILPEDTEIVFEVHDADIPPETDDPFDVVAHGLMAAGFSDILPLLRHESGNDTFIAYTPSGNRVEQSVEEADAVEAVLAEQAQEAEAAAAEVDAAVYPVDTADDEDEGQEEGELDPHVDIGSEPKNPEPKPKGKGKK